MISVSRIRSKHLSAVSSLETALHLVKDVKDTEDTNELYLTYKNAMIQASQALTELAQLAGVMDERAQRKP